MNQIRHFFLIFLHKGVFFISIKICAGVQNLLSFFLTFMLPCIKKQDFYLPYHISFGLLPSILSYNAFKGRRPNLKFRLSYLKSFGSSFSSHSLWLNLDIGRTLRVVATLTLHGLQEMEDTGLPLLAYRFHFFLLKFFTIGDKNLLTHFLI